MVREQRQYDDWAILDRRIVGQWGDGLLVWWLVLEESAPRGIWRPFITEIGGQTIKQFPTWAPLPGSQYQFLTAPVFETMFCGPRGDVADYSRVFTDKGWKRADEVCIHDKLLAPDGTFTQITAIILQGEKPIYRFTFEDGAVSDVSPDHLWLVQDESGGKDSRWAVRSTEQLMRFNALKRYVPLMSGAAPGRQWDGLDPYIAGLILGDGTLTGANVTIYGHADDIEERNYLANNGFSVKQYKPKCFQAYVTRKSANARWRELLGTDIREHKHAPVVLLEADPIARLSFLQGLMDADGYVDEQGRCSFASCAFQLAKDVRYLVLSLGGKAVVRKRKRVGGFKGSKDWFWSVTIQHCGKFNPFRLTRKVKRVKPMANGYRRRIDSIELVGRYTTRCFSVAHSSHLYVIDDFVVTHNTGKSEMLLMDFAKEVGKGFGANWRGILFRQQLGDLDEMVRKTETLFKPIFPGFHFKLSKADYAACWPSGEQLLFRHMIDETEYKEYHGHQYPWIGWEELTQWPDLKAYKLMFSCCRPTAPGVPTRVRANTNPSGPGHNVVKKRFQLPGMFGKIIREPGEEPRVAIQSSLKENFVLLHETPNYANRVKGAALSKAQGDAWATGNWDVTEGGMFDDLWRSDIHVIPNLVSRQIPAGWQFSRSYDHGQAKPFSVLWWAESNGEPIKLPDGRWVGQIPGDLILFMEWYGTNGQEDTGLNMLAAKIAQGIKDRERDAGIGHRVLGGAADTEIWTKSSTGLISRAPIDDFQDKGVFWDQADKSHGSRKRGFTLIRERIGGALPNFDGTREKPGIFVCARCKHWLELVPPTPRALDDPDEIPKTYEDHPIDSTRYRLTWTFMGMKRREF